jgi:phage gpG-like protein
MDFGVKIEVDRNDLAAINALVTGLSDFDAGPLVTEIVQLGENQTRKRIESGGPGPDGTKWPPNKEGTPILFRTGRHLHDSIASSSSGTSGEWGAAWEFAHVHQEGAIIKPKNAKILSFMVGGKRVAAKEVYIPVRPFVGVSAEDAEEIKELVTDYLGRLLP